MKTSCSCALNAKRKAPARYAAYIDEYGVGILEQSVYQGFGFAAIHELRIDDVVIRIVSAKHTAIAEIARVFVSLTIALAFVGVNEDRAYLRIRVTRRDRRVWKQNDTLARLRPTEAVSARSAFGRIHYNESVISGARVYCTPRCVCNFGRERNNAETRGFHER